MSKAARIAPAQGQRLARGLILGFIQLGIAAFATLWATPKIVLGLGIEDFAAWGLLQSVFAAMALLAFGGLEAILVYGARPGAENITKALGLWQVGAALLGGVLLVLGLKPEWLASLLSLEAQSAADFMNRVRAALPAAAFFWASGFWLNWLWALARSRQHFGLLFITQTLASLGGPILAVHALVHGRGLTGFMNAQSMLNMILLTVLALSLKPFSGGARPSVADWREALRVSRWTFLFVLSAVALQSVDRFLAAPLGAAGLAAYSLASSLFQRGVSALSLVPTLLTSSVSRLAGQNEAQRSQRMVALALRFSGLAALALFVPLAGLSEKFLHAWVGPDLGSRALAPLQVLCAAGVLATLSAVTHAALLGMGRAAWVAITGLSGAALGLAIGFALAPTWGAPGAAACALGGYACLYVWRLALLRLGKEHRSLGVLAWGHALALALGLGLVLLLHQLSPQLPGQGLGSALLALALAGLFTLAAGLGLDFLWARWRKSESLWQVARGLAKGSRA